MKILASTLASVLFAIGVHQATAQADKPPYISPVPKSTFGTTLEQQEQQLKTDPLVCALLNRERNNPTIHIVRSIILSALRVHSTTRMAWLIGKATGICFTRVIHRKTDDNIGDMPSAKI